MVDRDDNRRKELVHALTGYGYEVIAATNGEQGRRFANGLTPGLLVVEAALLRPDDPFGVRDGRPSEGSSPADVIVFGASGGEALPDGAVVLTDAEPAGKELVLRVRTALVARELGLAADPGLNALAGDLEALPFFDLLPMLHRAVATGRVEVGGGELALDEGEVVAAQVDGQSGIKAFARLARTARGQFRVALGPAEGERQIFKDLLSLMAIAIEDQHLYEEARSGLRGLSNKLRLVMGPVFFSTQFSPIQQRVLEAVQGSRTLWNVLDRVASPDGEVLTGLAQLHGLGIVELEDPEVEVRIVTDSAADLPPHLAARLGVRIVQLPTIPESQPSRQGTGPGRGKPQPRPPGRGSHRHRVRVGPVTEDELLSVYRAVVGRSDVVSLHVSERLSQTVVNARTAAAKGHDEFYTIRGDGTVSVEVVDGAQVGVGETLLVLCAVRMALDHLRAGEIRARIEAVRERVHALFVADTLEFPMQEGLFGTAQAWLRGLLGVKPILGVSGGQLAVLDQVRTARTAHPRVVELLAQRVDAERPVLACIAHSEAPVSAVRLRSLLQDSFRVAELIEGEIGPPVVSLLGRGCVGVALFQPTAEEERLLSPVAPDW